MSVEPNLDHPLVEIACRLLRSDPEEHWIFDEEAAQLLEGALYSQRSDPTLASAVLGLFHLATDLHRAHGADAAAGRIFALLGTVGPKLFSQPPPEVEDAIEQARRSFGEARVLPAQHGAAPPEGTIPASVLQQAHSTRRR